DITGSKQNALNLREMEEQLGALFELSPLGIAMTDMSGRFVKFNEAFRAICGYSSEELKAIDYWKLTPEKYLQYEALQMETLVRTGRFGPYEKEYVRRDGSLVPLSLTGVMIAGRDGQQYIWSIVEDITQRRATEQAQRIAASAFESQQGMYVTDAQNVILRVNKLFTEVTGYSADEAVGQTPRMLRSGQHDAAFYAAMWDSIHRLGSWRGEILNRRKNGTVYPQQLSITSVKNEEGLVSHYVAAFQDLTPGKAAEEQIRSLAFLDLLTGLPNRRLLIIRLQQDMIGGERQKHQSALLLLDLDNFRNLNDALGHDQGDRLLQCFARRLRACLREEDTVARVGGDEFGVLLQHLGTDPLEALKRAETVANKILEALRQPNQIDGSEISCTCSIGITLFGEQYENTIEPLKRAELAMYQAKAAGCNTLRFFDPQMQAAVSSRIALEAALREAVARQEFVLHYQPQMTGDGSLAGVEALLRWQVPGRGMVSPAEFIALAEETGLIMPIGAWVLETACRQLALWASAPSMARLSIAVNVSARQFHQDDFADQVMAVLQRTGAPANRLKLELTESLMVANIEGAIARMNTLKEQGVGFSLDDFGTGYSCLYYLKRLPLEELKIDQGFVRDILVDANDAAIARMVIALGDSMGLTVIAEGVETEAQRDLLAGMGCHRYQGYLFSRPLPLAQLEAWISARALQCHALVEDGPT
ncbi:MAG: EAL domain-containing protein, partial [Rhodoferax sp.]